MRNYDQKVFIQKSSKTEIKNCSYQTFPKKYIKKEIDTLWLKFISAFDYDTFYKNENCENTFFNGQSIYLNTRTKENSKPSKNSVIINIKEFFKKNNITYDKDYCLFISAQGKLLCENKNIFLNTHLLNEVKIWIMFIELISNNTSGNHEIIIKIFSHALEFEINTYFLFEFFLIFFSCSKNSKKGVELNSFLHRNIDLIPKEFLVIFKENQDFLTNLIGFTFNEEKTTYINKNIFLENNENLSAEFSFSRDQSPKCSWQTLIKNVIIPFNQDFDINERNPPNDENKSPCLDHYLKPSLLNDEEGKSKEGLNLHNVLKEIEINNEIDINNENDTNNSVEECDIFDLDLFLNLENLKIIDKDYLSNGNFIIFEITNYLKEYYSKKDLDYLITPLQSFENYNKNEQQKVEKDLNSMRESGYGNFIYVPFNVKFLELINE
jgi:hypothetical protein